MNCRIPLLAAAGVALAIGCNKTSSTTIGAAGGTVSVANGPTLTFPAGALSADTAITIDKQTGAPAGALSSLYKFGPEGTTFAQPVIVTFPIPPGTTAASIYWTKSGSTTAYDALTTSISGTTASSHVTHFSLGFAGAACNSGSSCSSTNACHVAALACSSGSPVCSDTGNEPDGTSCGGSNVCSAGACGAPTCTAGLSCTPTSNANRCENYATTCASSTSAPGCSATGAKADGTSCGSGNICSGGACVAACVQGAACTPSSPAQCKAYTWTSCTSATAGTCGLAGDAPAGTACGTAGNACLSGSCVAARTVSGTLQTIYEKDDLTTTTVHGAPPELPFSITGILVADDSATGYTTIPVTLDANSHFSVPNVPTGTYFLQVDQPYGGQGVPAGVITRTWYEMTANTPDLSIYIAGRSDRAAQTVTPTTVAFNMNDGISWATGDSMIITSSQGSVYNRPTTGQWAPAPSPGDTHITASYDWQNGNPGSGAAYLPNASKGDITYVYHRATTSVGTGPATTPYHYASEFLKLTNLTVGDGTGATISGTMSLATQSGSLSGDWRSSQFAALATAVNPGATASASYVSYDGPAVFAVPYSVTYPTQSQASATPLGFYALPDATTDENYGTLHYGQFLDSYWKEYVQVIYYFDYTLDAPGVTGDPGPVTTQDFYFANLPMTQAPSTFAPTLWPPTAPLINGSDAFTSHSGVGKTPTISWSAPATGTPTRYTVGVGAWGALQSGDIANVSAVVYSGTSFKLPGNYLKTGTFYSGSVTALVSPNVLDGPQFAQGTPSVSVSCDFGFFTP